MTILTEFEAALLCTAVTGTFSYFAWLILAKIFSGYKMCGLIYYTFKVTALFFLVPFVYCAMVWRYEVSDVEKGTFMQITPLILSICKIIAVVLVIGWLVSARRVVSQLWLDYRCRKTYRKIDGGEEDTILELVSAD